MEVTAKMKFLGVEKGVSRNTGKPYYRVGLLQGLESEQIYVSETLYKQMSDFKPLSNVECCLNIQISQKTFVNLVSVELVK